MRISYNATGKRFIIECNFSENMLIQAMPNKRWQKRTKTWHVSPMSRSCEYMLERLSRHMTPEAIEVAEGIMAKTSFKYEPFPSWYPYKTTPFLHQRHALDHSWSLPYDAFYMEMGTGKTKTSLDLVSAKVMNGDIRAVLVFCPLAVTNNWVTELGIHSPIPDWNVCRVHNVTDAKFREMEKGTGPRFVIVGYESIRSGFKKGRAFTQALSLLANTGKYAVIIDECHFIKNPESITSQNVEWLASHATLRYIMTGTPIAQGILDLYQQFKTLDPNIIGMADYYSFRNRYAEMGGYENKEVVGYRNVEELMGLIKPFVFQCTKDEVLDLPEKMYTTRYVTMSDEQTKVYTRIKKDCEAFVKDVASKNREPTKVEVDTVLAKYSALQQVTGGFIRHKESDDEEAERITTRLVEPMDNPKVQALLAIAEENPGKKIIIWARFREEINQVVTALHARYPGSVCQYHGGIEASDRVEEMRRFKEDPAAMFFVSNQQTGGTGLTLNESHLTVYYSNNLQLVHRQQSEDRNHRIGQKNSVLYVDLVCAGTVDEETLDCLRNKKDVADYVKQSMSREPTNGNSQPPTPVV